MKRRTLLGAAAVSLLSAMASSASGLARSRVRPGDRDWPAPADWGRLRGQVNGRLIEVSSPITPCIGSADRARTAQVFANLRNPYYLGDEAGLTQALGWVDAWTSQPSAYAVAAETTADIVAAVNFARAKKLRLIVKGGGHSYHGASNAAGSLLIWTRRMQTITTHDDFIAKGCEQASVPAATIGAGALWGRAYDEAARQAGRYVQGGGCLTVGVAGLIQGGGFGPFSKAYGLAAASLIEAEIVTADGVVRIANACINPDLFWALKGGGGGSFGVVTRLTLRTHDFPNFFGGVFATIKARSTDAWRRLIARLIAFYAEALFNPHWGEQITFRPGHEIGIGMVFQGLSQKEAEAAWRPFFDWVRNSPQDFTFAQEPAILAAPARDFWSPQFLKGLPGLILSDDRPGAPEGNLFWASNRQEAGQVLHGYQSCWLAKSFLAPERQETLIGALFRATRHWSISLHFNKGLAGAPASAIDAARDTAMNPQVLDAFALAIAGAHGPPAYPGVPGYEPDIAKARQDAAAIDRAMAQLRDLDPSAGSYVSESDFFERDWQTSFWGANYDRLLKVKRQYDPEGLFIVHHGVGSEGWSAE
ncbi:FAD-binding oxidoreductase [Nordella sp. HKS 07]|uniref:FAD-dependent oxidoreductase n=1 Tax=Nordella sp. HKS 07 TaxID=2712222 RepID=UPI0013E18704|nr:FAD-binding oxidoreductase [Nordella sp. HKS 07]QIG50525.1 FAD-binding oxidoreductase [Nordella sp. HKS 07]